MLAIGPLRARTGNQRGAGSAGLSREDAAQVAGKVKDNVTGWKAEQLQGIL